jgi:tripartite-type tricarboxylate transporter receptor subunit TctC
MLAVAASLIASVSLSSFVTRAEAAYPEKPITMIVPFSPGGASDVVARTIQQKLSEVLGQNVVVENRAGAGGNIGVDVVIRAKPDGYTVLLGNIGTMAINAHIYKDMTFDPVKKLKPVTELVATPGVLVVNPSLPINSVADFIRYAKENPGKLSFASSGSATLNRLQMELFRLEEGLDLVHVPHSGGAGPSMTSVVAGHVPSGFASLSSAIGHIKEGRLRALGVTSKERLSMLPDVPTMLELGFPANVSASWQGVLVPAETPDNIVKTLREALIKTVNDPTVKARLEETTSFIETSVSSEAFGEFIKAESDKWKGVIEKVGATVD